MRVIARHPEASESFRVRDLCPSIPLLANLGLVQLNYGFDAGQINRLVDTVEADGIFLHVNPLQEAIQPEGDTNFESLIPKLAAIIPEIKVPIIIKEVGTGIDAESARRLRDIGIRWIDVAGAGGTSWAWVEGYRRQDRLGHVFKDTGIPTDQAIREAAAVEGLSLIGSGGVRSGLDVAKVLMMGARLGAAARPFLEPALQGRAPCLDLLRAYRREFRTAMFCVGARTVYQLRRMKLREERM